MSGTARSVAEDEALRRRESKLTAEDRKTVERMLVRKDRIVDIAYWFRVSPSTVHKIKKAMAQYSRTVTDLIADAELPPPGPYLLVARTTYDKVQSERDAAAMIIVEFEGLLQKYRGKVAAQVALVP